jgi:hypothetical protein
MHSRHGVENARQFFGLTEMACGVGQNTCINA